MSDIGTVDVSYEGLALLVNSIAVLTIENADLTVKQSKADAELKNAKSNADYWQERALKVGEDYRQQKERADKAEDRVAELEAESFNG